MSKKTVAYLFVLLAVTLSSQAFASAIPAAGCSYPTAQLPLPSMDRQYGNATQVSQEMGKPVVVIMGESADLYLLFPHHVIGFTSSNESPLPEAGKILDNIR